MLSFGTIEIALTGTCIITRNLKHWLVYFPPGLCSTKGQWAALTPPMATCRRHPSPPVTCWAETKSTVPYTGLQRSASGGPTAARTYKVLIQILRLLIRTHKDGLFINKFYECQQTLEKIPFDTCFRKWGTLWHILGVTWIKISPLQTLIIVYFDCVGQISLQTCLCLYMGLALLSHGNVLRTKIKTVVWVMCCLLVTSLEYLCDRSSLKITEIDAMNITKGEAVI